MLAKPLRVGAIRVRVWAENALALLLFFFSCKDKRQLSHLVNVGCCNDGLFALKLTSLSLSQSSVEWSVEWEWNHVVVGDLRFKIFSFIS